VLPRFERDTNLIGSISRVFRALKVRGRMVSIDRAPMIAIARAIPTPTPIAKINMHSVPTISDVVSHNPTNILLKAVKHCNICIDFPAIVRRRDQTNYVTGTLNPFRHIGTDVFSGAIFPVDKDSDLQRSHAIGSPVAISSARHIAQASCLNIGKRSPQNGCSMLLVPRTAAVAPTQCGMS